MRDAEDQMIVIHRQQFALPCRQPLFACIGLALWAVAVSAGVVGDGLISAARALITMTAKRCRPAAQDRMEHLHLSPVQELTITTCDAGIGSADDIGNLKPRTIHRCCFPAAQAAFETDRGC